MKTDLRIVRQRLKATMAVLPYKVGVLMVAFTKERFQQQNWLDTYPEKWKPRKKSKWKGKDDTGRALLIKSGRLRRSIRIIGTTANSVTIGSDVPYASAHNDGVRLGIIQKVGPHTRKRFAGGVQNVAAHTRRIDQNIPRRRFMGQSKYLTMQINRLITAEINKTFNQ